MENLSRRPTWPYALGTFGAGMFALGALLLLAALASKAGSVDVGRVGSMFAGGGCLLMGITWSKLLRAGSSGVGQILMCFAVPLALLYLATRSGFEGLRTSVVVLCLTLCGFALAHLFAPRLPLVRWASAGSLVGLIPLTLSVTGNVNLHAGERPVMVLAFGGLTAIGVLVAAGMATLKRAAADPYAL